MNRRDLIHLAGSSLLLRGFTPALGPKLTNGSGVANCSIVGHQGLS